MNAALQASPREGSPCVPGDGIAALGRRAGVGLVEVMLGCLILGILAITAAAYVFHTTRALTLNRNRTAALVAVNSCLEGLRAMNYTTLTNAYVSGSVVSNNINGVPVRIRREDIGLARTNDASMMTVQARYSAPPTELWISNVTIRGP